MGSYECPSSMYEPIVNKINLLGGICITSDECYRQADVVTGKKVNAIYGLVELLRSVAGVVFIEDVSRGTWSTSEETIRSMAALLNIKRIYPIDLTEQIAQLAEMGALEIKNKG